MRQLATFFRHTVAALLTISTIVMLPLLSGCGSEVTKTRDETLRITAVVDSFHIAAARADFKGYFERLTDDAVFIGTDATERWDKKSFMDFSKPYFDRGKAWNFTTLERHISIDESGNVAWFDELLNTQMKICRGSGVLVKEGEAWKIRHYVLSMTIPNELMDTVVTLKSSAEDRLISSLPRETVQ